MNKGLYKAAVNDIKVDENIIKELALKMKSKPIRRKNIKTYGIMAASVAVLLIAAIIVQNKTGLLFRKRIAQLTPNSSISQLFSKDTIYINKIEGVKSSKLFIPEDSYSKDYTIQQLTEVFGRDPMPKIPKEFKPASNDTDIIFDAQGKMLFMSALSFSKDINNPDAPSIDIRLNKNALPPKDCLYAQDALKESVIGSTKVVIGAISMGDKYNDDGKSTAFYDLYSAEFIYNGIGYNITTKRTDGQILLDLLDSIIK